MKKSLLVSALGLILLAGAGVFYFYELNKTPVTSTARQLVFEVKPGMSFSAVAKELKKNGLIRNLDAFRLYARLTKMDSRLKVGEYALFYNMNADEILQVITSGKSIEHNLTFSEGLSTYEMAEVFAKSGLGSYQDFFSLTRNPALAEKLLGEKLSSLEGYLFPETYKVTKYTKAIDVVTQMVQRFLQVYPEVLKNSELPGTWTRHQVVTLASIIEKETGAAHERPLISSVFHNRLQKNIKLQTDPTIIYGKAEISGKIVINITKQDLSTFNRYNTYTIYGLPPGPIANPGKEALQAAVRPDTSEYIFFVSRNDGTHIFSRTYGEHQKAVDEFQKRRGQVKPAPWRNADGK
ncbi:MAG: endolytic transglycosylase MltG [Pseudobdellovibrionaceae bacterium]